MIDPHIRLAHLIETVERQEMQIADEWRSFGRQLREMRRLGRSWDEIIQGYQQRFWGTSKPNPDDTFRWNVWMSGLRVIYGAQGWEATTTEQ